MADHPTGLMEWTFAEQLRSYRRGRQLTQEQLAERAGLSVRTISGLESETHRHAPYPDTLRLLAEALELSPTEREALLAGVTRQNARRISAEISHRTGQLSSPEVELLPSRGQGAANLGNTDGRPPRETGIYAQPNRKSGGLTQPARESPGH
jgi:transcriptional regulator with XRE-family HTH domain